MWTHSLHKCFSAKTEGTSKCASCQTSFDCSDLGNTSKSLIHLSILPENYCDSNEPKACHSCDEAHAATQKCLDCGEYFCDFMARTHLRQKLSTHHRMVSIDDFERQNSHHRRLGYLQFKSCPKHNKQFEFLNLNCRSHNELLCSGCLTGVLPSLHLVPLDESFTHLIFEKMERIHEMQCEWSKRLSGLRAEEKWLSKRLGELEQSKEQALGEIRRVFGSLREALDARQRKLEQEVEELNKNLSFSLCEERERSRVRQGQLSLLGECVVEMKAWVHSHKSSSSSSESQSHSLPSESSTLTPDKGLMVDVCLLEDALRNSLFSSKASSLSVQEPLFEGGSIVRFRLHHGITFSFSPKLTPSHSQPYYASYSTLDSLSTKLSGIGIVSSFASKSLCTPQHLLSFSLKGKNGLFSASSFTYSPHSKLFYVADSSSIRIFRNNPQAEIEGRLEIESAEKQNNGKSDPFDPDSIFIHDGLLYICESDKKRVRICREEDGFVGHNLTFDFHPRSCTMYDNHLFVYLDNRRIQKFSLPDFAHVLTFGSEGIGYRDTSPCELVVFNGKLYLTDQRTSRISVFDPDTGKGLYVIGPSLSNGETFSCPRGLRVFNNLLFVSSSNCILVLDEHDRCLYSFKSYGPKKETFSSIKGMSIVGHRLFVCQQDRIEIFKFNLG